MEYSERNIFKGLLFIWVVQMKNNAPTKRRMSEDGPIVMMLIDAFSNDYLSKEDTPFLYSMANNGYHYQIDSLFAYRGIEATIFSGVSPNIHKIWTEFCLKSDVTNEKKEKMKYSIFKKVITIVDAISNDRLSGVSRYVYHKYILRSGMHMTNLIPVDISEHFETSQPYIFKPNALGEIPTLFDIFRENNNNFIFLAAPITKGDNDALNKTLYTINKENYNFWFMKFGSLDPLGHKFGPRSEELKKGLKRVDFMVEQVVDKFQAKYRDPIFIILSDHGMTEVKKTINVMHELEGLNLSMPKDYIMFLDSTMARFWFFNQKARIKIMDKLSDIQDGYILDNSNLEQLGIDKVGYRYGEEIFALEEGYTISPDFFRRGSPPKGMHGHAFESDNPILIISSPKIDLKRRKKVRFVDLVPTVLDLMGLHISHLCGGSSLLADTTEGT